MGMSGLCGRRFPCVAEVRQCSPSEPSVLVFPLSRGTSFTSSPGTVRTGPTLLGSCGCDELVEGCVEPLVDYLLIGIGVVPVEDLTCAEREGDRAGEFWHHRLDFAVVEDHRMGLV